MAEPTLFPESGFRRLRIDLAYDGTEFFGWARQPDRRSVQEEIEEVLSRILKCDANVVVAGRTDAGVHASAQVIHVDIPESSFVDLEYKDIIYKLNRILDEDVRILDIATAPEGFHARFSALRRYYRYKIIDDNRAIPPISRIDIAPWYRRLDLALLNDASARLLGHHDFAAFCKFKVGGTTIRTLETFRWQRNEEGTLVADVVADAFCYSMVRNLVGAVVSVADGRRSLEWLENLLANRERVADSMVFPSRGLTLYRVDYPADSELLERAKVTVAKRTFEEK